MFHLPDDQAALQTHWETLYTSKSPDQRSWTASRLDVSLGMIERAALPRSASVIDIGGGESTLVDDLLDAGYANLTVLDLSSAAIDANRKRLGARSEAVRWLVTNLAAAPLESASFDLWHDRAVFHFLTTASHRAAYIRQAVHALKPGGYLVLSTFGPEGPTRCSGLAVVRYSAATLQAEFSPRFRLLESSTYLHHTPFGTTQQFLSCLFRA